VFHVKHEDDYVHMAQVLKLAEQSYQVTKAAFAAKITHEDGRSLTAMALPWRATGHPEAIVVKEAVKRWGRDLSACTVYSNFEPCPMCSFLIRDFCVSRVVYALPSPHWGGSDRWPILHSLIDAQYTAAGKDVVPDVVVGVMGKEAEAFFEKIGWTMHRVPVSRETLEMRTGRMMRLTAVRNEDDQK
jgi:tRNA(Arg) A34 adenosine deaminase TadA